MTTTCRQVNASLTRRRNKARCEHTHQLVQRSSSETINKMISSSSNSSSKLALLSNCFAILLVIAQLNSLIVQPTGAQQSFSATPSSTFDTFFNQDLHSQSQSQSHDHDHNQQQQQQPAQYSSNLNSISASNGNNNNPLQSQQHQQHQQQQQQQQQVSHKSPLNGRQFGDTINDIQIECNSNSIVVTLQTNQGFNGMIYPKGLSKNSTCMMEYHQMTSNITYYLPLKSCNTMSTDVEDGVEYFNTVMVQPHRRLVTNQGRGYHIRCRYQTKERTITNQEQQLSVNLTQVTPSVMGSASMPACTMRIYGSSDLQHEVSAENVRIGDELHLIISLDDQDVYGMLVTNCLVRDGMNWGEQPLIDDRGCPVDEEIMPEFVYAKNLTRASVTFQAHKFPYTSSVYYQCNVRLCFRDNGNCGQHVPPNCSGGNNTPTLNKQLATSGSGSGSGSNLANKQEHQYRAAAAASDVDVESGSNDLAPAPVRPLRPNRQAAGVRRDKRWVDAGELDGVASDELLRRTARVVPVVGSDGTITTSDMSIEVSSGLHVADGRDTEPGSSDAAPAVAESLSQADPLMMAATNDDPEERIGGVSQAGGVNELDSSAATSTADQDQAAAARERQQKQSEREFCLSLRKFAIIVSLISLLLMTAIIILIACLIKRRNRQKLDAQLNSTYDHHHNNSGVGVGGGGASPYTNRAYCRD